MGRRNCLSRGGLKIHYIESLVWRGNDVASSLKTIKPVLEEFFFVRRGMKKVCKTACKNARAGDHRAGAENLEEFSAGLGPAGRVSHTHLPPRFWPTLAAKCSATAGRGRGKLW